VATGYVLARLGLPVLRWLPALGRVVVAAIPALAIWFLDIPDLAKAVLGLIVYAAVLALVRGVPEELYVEVRRLRRRTT
jgi:hypothetical protein